MMIKAIRTSMLGAMLLVLSAADAPGPVPSVWLQARVDRILVAAGRDVMVPTVVSDDAEPAPDVGGPLRVPGAIIEMAPTAQALDGLLAMLLSFHIDGGGSRSRPGGAASTIAAAALLAATGGTTDAAEGRNVRTIPLGDHTSGPPGRTSRAALALRGLRWNGLAGNCVTSQIAFLRLIASPTSSRSSSPTTAWRGSRFAREVVRDLGMEAYPRQETCDETADPDFVRIRSSLASARQD